MTCLQIEIPCESFRVILKLVIPAFCRKGCFFFPPENTIYCRDLWALFCWLLVSAVFLLALSKRIRNWKNAPLSLQGGEILWSVFSYVLCCNILAVASVLFKPEVLLNVNYAGNTFKCRLPSVNIDINSDFVTEKPWSSLMWRGAFLPSLNSGFCFFLVSC